MEPYDLVAIGDIVVDDFIRLTDPSFHVRIDQGNRELTMRFGQKVPFESSTLVAAVGNSPNAAVSASRLGLRAGLVVTVGKDRDGEDCLAQLQKEGVSTEFVTVHPTLPTNHHYVMWFEDERTILIKHQAYPYAIPAMAPPRWIYLSSIGEHGKEFHATLAAYLAEHPETKLAFQPGTFQILMGAEALKDVYAHTEVFFCNRQEAAAILGTSDQDVKALLTGVLALGPKTVVITDGPDGAYAATAAGRWFVPKYPDPAPPLERTGAGDAFASTVVSALALGVPVEQALLWAPVNSMSVVQQVGAQAGLLTRAALEELLAKAPASYVATPLP
jgi:ribokinase